MIEQAVILAAGEGERLRPFTTHKPKGMIYVANKPVLLHVVEALSLGGIRRIVMVVGYGKEHILDFFGSGEKFGVEVEYVTQSQQLGTAHALKQAKEKVDKEFLVIFGDNLVDTVTVADFIQTPPDAILLKELAGTANGGEAVVKGNRLLQLVEKPSQPLSNLISTGIFSFTRAIFDYLQSELDLPGAIQLMLSDGCKVSAARTAGTWFDIIYPWDILKSNYAVLKSVSPNHGGTIEKGVTIKDPVSIGEGTVIRANSYIVGPVAIGEGCDIGPNVCIMPGTSIGNRVTISPFSQIENSVLGEDVSIGSGANLADCIIDRGCRIGAHFSARSGDTEVKVGGAYHQAVIGTMMGESCEIGDGVVVSPGVVVGNQAKVKGLKLLEGNVPDGALVV